MPRIAPRIPRRQTRRAARRAARLAAAALTATVAATAFTPSSASAYAPDPRLSDTIEMGRSSIAGWSEYGEYLQFHDGYGPDGVAGPDGTPDGRGAFRFYYGSKGSGAVYAVFQPAGLNYGVMWGQILDSWAASGYETGPYGYPVGLQLPAAGHHIDRGCYPGDEAQYFEKQGNYTYQPVHRSVACLEPSTGTVYWNSWTLPEWQPW